MRTKKHGKAEQDWKIRNVKESIWNCIRHSVLSEHRKTHAVWNALRQFRLLCQLLGAFTANDGLVSSLLSEITIHRFSLVSVLSLKIAGDVEFWSKVRESSLTLSRATYCVEAIKEILQLSKRFHKITINFYKKRISHRSSSTMNLRQRTSNL